MSEPLIYCIMPTRDRPEFVARSLRSFRSQSHLRRRLLVLDTGSLTGNVEPRKECRTRPSELYWLREPEFRTSTVGKIRNHSISECLPLSPDYIAHFDDDDWSAPDRLSIQLAHIQKTGKLVTGFFEIPLYDVVNDKVWIYSHEKKQNFALGTSLFYKCEAWERVKFPEDRVVDDNLWRQKIGGENIDSISGFRADGSPIMIQVVHGGNASARIVPNSKKFREAGPELAAEVREILRTA